MNEDKTLIQVQVSKDSGKHEDNHEDMHGDHRSRNHGVSVTFRMGDQNDTGEKLQSTTMLIYFKLLTKIAKTQSI